ncbi:MAG: adenylate/guanylate cyclase domain-containing protein [Spirochaetaceae bacterium]|nr:adenylate/guanylate cyclase domain-containing protein [Spirochaetaceae bacterium]
MIKKVFAKLTVLVQGIIHSPYTFKILSLIVLTILMIMPFSMMQIDLLHTESTPLLLYPLTVLFSVQPLQFSAFYICCIFLFLLPIVSLLIILSFFILKIHKVFLYIACFVALSVYLICAVSGVIAHANTPLWFYALSKNIIFAFVLAFVFHLFFVIIGIVSIRSKTSLNAEYDELLYHSEKNRAVAKHQKLTKKKTEQKEFIEKSESVLTTTKNFADKMRTKINEGYAGLKRLRIHVKTKISVVIVLTITIILLIFIYTDLNNYRSLLTQTINTTGANLAEQTSEIFTYSDGLNAKISSYLEGLRKTNASASFPCERVDIITTSNKNYIPVDEIDSSTQLPDFDIFSYTTAVGRVKEIPEGEKRITSNDAALFMQHSKSPTKKLEPIYIADTGTYMYVHPIIITQSGVQKLIGFSVVRYKEAILDRPYFQAKVFVIAISAVFFYFTIIIAIFLADFIANPIIFLCGSVKKTSNILNDMLAGSANIETKRLTFDDSVWTNDEVKDLSNEVNYFVSLVKGMLPYVSFHTIQRAEKTVKRQATSRNLCFLFTDIRGFTSMCETLPAKDVVPILNHYLDIETKIIFENDGDIDKYVGDAVMAFFSGPKKEINACRAAMQIRKAIRQEQQRAKQDGVPPVAIGIGIHTGKVVFGSIGAKTRKDFTSIGDTVNIASRLESANKEYGSKSIISEAVYENLHGTFVCRELDTVMVKGRQEPQRIFEILQTVDDASDKLYEIKELFENGLYYYRRRKWDEAEQYFIECRDMYNDAPSKVFLKRIAHYREIAPKSTWKGIHVMNSK